jgi:sulfatase maturation enzyme AslB (radical SAM superfamily)
MKVINAIKKLEKAGFEVINDASRYSARRGNDIIEFIKNGGDSDQAICIRIMSASDRDDLMTDYSAGTFCDNLSQAIRIAG